MNYYSAFSPKRLFSILFLGCVLMLLQACTSLKDMYCSLLITETERIPIQ